MKTALIITLVTLMFVLVMLVVRLWTLKYKYFQASGKSDQDAFSGALKFMFAGMTSVVPVLGEDDNLVLEKLRRRLNRTVIAFYLTFFIIVTTILFLANFSK